MAWNEDYRRIIQDKNKSIDAEENKRVSRFIWLEAKREVILWSARVLPFFLGTFLLTLLYKLV